MVGGTAATSEKARPADSVTNLSKYSRLEGQMIDSLGDESRLLQRRIEAGGRGRGCPKVVRRETQEQAPSERKSGKAEAAMQRQPAALKRCREIRTVWLVWSLSEVSWGGGERLSWPLSGAVGRSPRRSAILDACGYRCKWLAQ